MAFSLSSGTSLTLVNLLVLCLSLATDASCPIGLDAEPFEEISHGGASFVQLNARSVGQSKTTEGSDVAGRSSNLTANPVDSLQILVQQQSVDVPDREDTWSKLAEQALSVQDDVDEPTSLLNDIEPRWLMTATFLACALLGVYFYERRSGTNSNPVANRPNALESSATDMVQLASPNDYRSTRDVVEDLGFGWAQLRLLLLADGIWFLDGWELALMGTVTTSTASDLGLGVYGRAKLASMLAFGFIPGNLLGGWFGDHFGRRPPILLSYILMVASAWWTSVAPDAVTLLALRFLMGVAVGLGMPCSTVLISELTPVQWRTTMFAFRGALYTTGSLFAHLSCWMLDPSLEHLNWRLCIRMTIPPILIFLIPTFVFLRESPVFLACMGDHTGAKCAFERMRQQNNCPEVSISYLCHADNMNRQSSRGSLWDHLQVMFGVGTLGCTTALILASVSASVFSSGHGYGLARVLIEEADKHKIDAGAQLLIDSAWGYVACLMLFALDRFFSRKRMLVLFSLLLAFGFAIFAWTGRSPWQFWLVTTVLQMSLALLRMVLKMNMMMVALASTECYPTAMVSTGSGVIAGCGRLGAITSPMIYEWFHATVGVSTAFHAACSCLAIFNLFALSELLPENLESAKDMSINNLKVIVSRHLMSKKDARAI